VEDELTKLREDLDMLTRRVAALSSRPKPPVPYTGPVPVAWLESTFAAGSALRKHGEVRLTDIVVRKGDDGTFSIVGYSAESAPVHLVYGPGGGAFDRSLNSGMRTASELGVSECLVGTPGELPNETAPTDTGVKNLLSRWRPGIPIADGKFTIADCRWSGSGDNFQIKVVTRGPRPADAGGDQWFYSLWVPMAAEGDAWDTFRMDESHTGQRFYVRIDDRGARRYLAPLIKYLGNNPPLPAVVPDEIHEVYEWSMIAPGTAVRRGDRWCRENPSKLGDGTPQIGILTGFKLFYDGYGSTIAWPAVHWEGDGKACVTHPLDAVPYRQDRFDTMPKVQVRGDRWGQATP